MSNNLTQATSSNDTLYIDVALNRKDFHLQVKQAISLRGITGIFGHSGSGKSTLLRIISGLENSVTGTLAINEQLIIDSQQSIFIKAEKRNIGLVFQDARLFPHLTVEQNLLFALKRKKNTSKETTLTFDDVVAATQLKPLLLKKDHELSGGEKQRVALARALLAAPKFLLLDEPFSALDHNTKRTLLRLLVSIQQQFKIPMFYVSHAIDELQQISDNLLVLKQGKVVSFGNSHQVIHQLAQENTQIAPITSLSLPLIKHLHEYGLSELALNTEQAIYLPLLPEFSQANKQDKTANNAPENSSTPATTVDFDSSSNIRCLIYAEDISIAIEKPEHSSIVNKLSGVINAIEVNNKQVLITVNCAQQAFFVSITLWSFEQLALQKNQHIYIQFKAGAVRTINSH